MQENLKMMNMIHPPNDKYENINKNSWCKIENP
jgi:hypothetical protein